MSGELINKRGGGVIGKKRKICTSKSAFHKSSHGEGGELGKQGRELGKQGAGLGKRRRCRLGERKVV